jgi:hypothetical protein
VTRRRGLDCWIDLLGSHHLTLSDYFNYKYKTQNKDFNICLPGNSMNLKESVVSRILSRLSDSCLTHTYFKSKSHCECSSVSQSWCRAPIWGSWPDIYYCFTVTVLLFWGALSDERTGLSFVRVTVCISKSFVIMYFWVCVLCFFLWGVTYAPVRSLLQVP